jgi:hypothetical protein
VGGRRVTTHPRPSNCGTGTELLYWNEDAPGSCGVSSAMRLGREESEVRRPCEAPGRQPGVCAAATAGMLGTQWRLPVVAPGPPPAERGHPPARPPVLPNHRRLPAACRRGARPAGRSAAAPGPTGTGCPVNNPGPRWPCQTPLESEHGRHRITEVRHSAKLKPPAAYGLRAQLEANVSGARCGGQAQAFESA